jgi:gas vesicle structural protein
MPVERTVGGTSLIDVLDRVLDKGIVIDAWVRVSLVGIDLITVEARIVVASIETYLKYSEAVGTIAPVAKPAHALESGRSLESVMAENVALRAQLAAEGAPRRPRRAPRTQRATESAPRRARAPRGRRA